MEICVSNPCCGAAAAGPPVRDQRSLALLLPARLRGSDNAISSNNQVDGNHIS